ncbi:MAG: ArsC/Spx/MgsR family protein [Pseudomonadota bacterium]
MTRLFGISTCDTCRKARKVLENAGLEVVFQDVRNEPLGENDISRFLGVFGEKLINTRSTTWRGLSEDQRQASPQSLLTSHPTLMKRPVLATGEVLTLGWTHEIAEQHLAAD